MQLILIENTQVDTFVGENSVIGKNRFPKPNIKFSTFSLLIIDRGFKLLTVYAQRSCCEVVEQAVRGQKE